MSAAVGTTVGGDRENGPVRSSAPVCLGTIAAPHGLRGEVRIKCFTEDPRAIAAYGPLHDRDGGRRFEIEITGAHKGGVRARIAGCTDRNQAEALRGVLLCVDRAALPRLAAHEFYHTDLEGLRVENAGGGTIGRVVCVHDFGGGTVLEVQRRGGRSVLIPFTREAVPEVDIEQGRILVEAPLAGGEAE